MNPRPRRIRAILKLVPLLGAYLAAQDFSELAEQRLEPRNRILAVGRDRLAVLPVDHELMSASRIRTFETELTQPADEVSSPTRIQPWQR